MEGLVTRLKSQAAMPLGTIGSVLISLILVGCGQLEVTPSQTAVPALTPGTVPPLSHGTATPTPAISETATATANTATPHPPATAEASSTAVVATNASSVSPTGAPATSPTSAPPSQTGAVSGITAPLLIDGEAGRIYAAAQVNAVPKTVVLSTQDGRLLAAYDVVGKLALDRANQRLVVDQEQGDLVILDANTGATLATVNLPSHAEGSHPAPQVDPQTGRIFAFRDKTVHVIDPAAAAVTRTVELSVEGSVCGVEEVVPIAGSQYDLVQQKLYLSFYTWVCTPWVGATIIAYDGRNLTELGRYQTEANYQSVPYQGSLYGTTTPRLQAGVYWAWNNDDVWFERSEQPKLLQGIVADWGRQLIYEAAGGQIRVVAATTRERVTEVEVPQLEDDQARLAGHDPITDQLYFLTGGGRLHIWPAGNLFQAGQQPTPAVSGLPATAVRSLSVSPAWPADRTIVGLWQNPNCPETGGSIYVLAADEDNWRPAPVEPATGAVCEAIAAIALSPNYAQDRVIFAAADEPNTIFKSSDGGRSWQPAGTAFPSGTRFSHLFVSSGFAQDRTVFTRTSAGDIYRSQDGGQNWQALGRRFDRLAISPEFGQDRTLMGAEANQLFVSYDGGDNWELVGSTPNGETLNLLSLAPLYAKWETVFAFSANGNFYRSLDGGNTWELKMTTADVNPAQIVYGPDMEENRPVFLLHGTTLDASYDGGSSIWSGGPGDKLSATATALAISPDFVSDGLLFVGTADGQVITVDASRP